jgi:hypothetical protein
MFGPIRERDAHVITRTRSDDQYIFEGVAAGVAVQQMGQAVGWSLV